MTSTPLQIAKYFKQAFGALQLTTTYGGTEHTIAPVSTGDIKLLRILAHETSKDIRKLYHSFFNKYAGAAANFFNLLCEHVDSRYSSMYSLDNRMYTFQETLAQCMDNIDNGQIYNHIQLSEVLTKINASMENIETRMEKIETRMEKIEQTNFAIMDKINILAQYIDEMLAHSKQPDLLGK